MAGLTCKCGKILATCQGCGGKQRKSFLGDLLHCGKCNDTGLVCPDHGAHWN